MGQFLPNIGDIFKLIKQNKQRLKSEIEKESQQKKKKLDINKNISYKKEK